MDATSECSPPSTRTRSHMWKGAAQMARRTPRTGFGPVIAVAVLLAVGAGTAYAADPNGTVARADGTRVTTASARQAAALDSGNDSAWGSASGTAGTSTSRATTGT